MHSYLEAFDCRTALGDADATVAALLEGRVALRLLPVNTDSESERVPLAARGDIAVTTPPRWWDDLTEFLATAPDDDWGSPRKPVLLSSSNFGIDRLYAIGTGATPDAEANTWATAHGIARRLRRQFGWGPNLHIFSHACVSAHLATAAADTWLREGVADKALVVSFDYVGPFVSSGFHSLKILNSGMPAPYADRPTGSVGLGDGTAWAVLSNDPSQWRIEGSSHWNELHHFTANDPSGSGFEQVIAPLAPLLEGHGFWIKGHGTGTLDAGRLEAECLHRAFPGVPLVSWKGSIGHTLGSCALVELVLALRAHESGSIPGTTGSAAPVFAPNVATGNFDAAPARSILLLCNAFGGAHGALLVSHV
ncbi:MAG: hypothetical protein JJU00_07765 [Opitutales bacterium]|nr:hypothetical protein [Opitutales bacterium]